MSGLGFEPHHIAAALTLPARHEFTAEGVSSALAALGTTPDDVAQSLFDAGILGDRGCETSCVLAEYLHLHFPGCRIEVHAWGDAGEEEAWAWLANPEDGETLDVQAPPAVAAVASQFDLGHHPQLERPRILAEVTA